MKLTTKGLIIRQQTIGESDTLVTLLTGDYGLVRAFVRRAKSIKSQNLSATSLFVYGEFSLYRGRDAYVIDSAEPHEIFFELRSDIERLALAQYFAQLAYFLSAEEQPAPDTLRLLLNALHLLCKGEKDCKIIKAACEMRMLCLGGFMPDVLACADCGAYEDERMVFDIDEGCIYCDSCKNESAAAVPMSVITAIRYICLADLKKVFSFNLSDENLATLSDLCEKYMYSHIDSKLTTLEFYKSLKL